MALIKCPNCGKTISDQAVVCPHCGAKPSPMAEEDQAVQHSLSLMAKALQPIAKTFLPMAVALAILSTILPLFVDFYGIVTRPEVPLLDRWKTPLTYAAIGVASVGGLVSVGLTVYGLVKTAKRKSFSWRYWIITFVVALASALATYFLTRAATDSFKEMYEAKVAAARGTYQRLARNGTTITISIGSLEDFGYQCHGYYVYEGQKYEIKNIRYDYTRDLLLLEMTDGQEDFTECYTLDMAYVTDLTDSIAVKKINDAPTHDL